MNELVVGQVLGRYELLLPIGNGGMAQVWAACLRGTRWYQNVVAVKTLLAGERNDDLGQRMFLMEAALASQIHHPNVVGTLEFGEEQGLFYIVMEWVDGESLDFVMNRAIGRGGMPLPIAVNLIGQACKGLHAAHELRDEAGAELGLVHRDISAQNVLVTYTGSAKLVDFGIAKAMTHFSDFTEAGEIRGKFSYLAPEQALGNPVDRRADIFGMGVLLYYVTTGRQPFKGTSPGETVQRVCSVDPVRPSQLVKGYPPELEAVVCKALSKAPDDRWATANDMLAALERAMPQCLDGSFEVRIADYMSWLLGNRSRERRNELRLAQQKLNRSGSEHLSLARASNRSSGSLPAVVVDPMPVTVADDGHSQSQSATSLRPSQPVGVVSQKRLAFTKPRLAASAAAVGGIVILGAMRPWSRAQDVQGAAPSAVVDAALAAQATERLPDPAAGLAPDMLLPAPAASEDEHRENAARKAARTVLVNRVSSVVTAAASVYPRPAQSVERPRDMRPNAWDPESFGGRR